MLTKSTTTSSFAKSPSKAEINQNSLSLDKLKQTDYNKAMSKTTIALLLILLIFIGILLFVLGKNPQTKISIAKPSPIIIQSNPPETTLSLSTDTIIVHTGQTISVSVLIHNPTLTANIAQLELAYDPMTLTMENMLPGNFFINPTVILSAIEPNIRRISYALHCPPHTNDCVNSASNTIATFTMRVNPYSRKDKTKLTLLPKTVMRDSNGKDIAYKTNYLELTITRNSIPIATSSAIMTR